jgi:hypothetical protein
LLSVVAMVAADFTEAEVFTAVVEVFTEEAVSGLEDFIAGAGFAGEGFTVEVGSEAEPFMAAARFGEEPAFAEEPSAADSGEAFVAMASGVVSVSADAALDGEAGAGVGA